MLARGEVAVNRATFDLLTPAEILEGLRNNTLLFGKGARKEGAQ